MLDDYSPVDSLSDDEDSQQSERDTDSSDPDFGLPDRETMEDELLETFIEHLRGYACELELDSNTAHRGLKLSEDNMKVTSVEEEQPYADHPERFDSWKQVMCREALTRRSFWEVEWSGEVTIAVTYRGISRKGVSDDCKFGENYHSWSLECADDGYTVRQNKEIITQTSSSSSSSSSSSTSYSGRVAVYVDPPDCSLSFYSVSSSDKLTHLHTFRGIYGNLFTVKEPLFAGFGLLSGSSSVSL